MRLRFSGSAPWRWGSKENRDFVAVDQTVVGLIALMDEAKAVLKRPWLT